MTPMREAKASFAAARPIWPVDREREMNLSVGFRAAITTGPCERAVLRMTASTIYRCYLNGEFVGNGPAAAAHGYFRLDEWDVTDRLVPGKNVVAVEVAGYNVNSYYLLDQPAFLQAEVIVDGRAAAATGSAATGAADGHAEPFEAHILEERFQKVPRYSFQRPFMEAYRLKEAHARWRADAGVPVAAVRCAEQPELRYLPRGVEYAAYEIQQPVHRTDIDGRMPAVESWQDRTLTGIGPDLLGYALEELELNPVAIADRGLNPVHAQLIDFGKNLSGFIGIDFTCTKPTKWLAAFDEILTDGDVDFKRLSCANLLYFELEPGNYRFQSMEIYTLQYMKLLLLEGEGTAEQVYVREYVNPQTGTARLETDDPKINAVFEAAVETFKQNAVDNFMDCPSRERAGWLCDSFFASRVAALITGNTSVEDNFFENFMLPESFAHLPKGMLPMCYPADHYNGMYIPNWSLWFVLQLEEYAARGGNAATISRLEAKVADLFEFFAAYRNEDGLLERLDSWVFLEWSDANQFTQDVNYPSNMLYAGALAAAGRLYGRSEWVRESEAVKETVRRQAGTELFFIDHAVREDGSLKLMPEKSEVCQYYAFYFGVATPESHPQLWQTLAAEFGPKRKQTRAYYPEVRYANAFMGNYLRLELLSRDGRTRQLMEEMVDYFHGMAELTGTLWEHDSTTASTNHGFASHVAQVLYRDLLGLFAIDRVAKSMVVRFGESDVGRCSGRVPIGGDAIALAWRKADGRLIYSLTAPEGYEVKVVNASGLELVREEA